MNEGSTAALLTFAGYTISVFLLAILSNRVAKGKDFVGEYFLGSRGFGVWAFALTFAATNHRVSGFDLHTRLDLGSVDRRLHGDAAGIDGVDWQTHQSDCTKM